MHRLFIYNNLTTDTARAFPSFLSLKLLGMKFVRTQRRRESQKNSLATDKHRCTRIKPKYLLVCLTD
ncbi:hypothetical protein MCEKH37_01319 [Methylophilaceae bacterium]